MHVIPGGCFCSFEEPVNGVNELLIESNQSCFIHDSFPAVFHFHVGRNKHAMQCNVTEILIKTSERFWADVKSIYKQEKSRFNIPLSQHVLACSVSFLVIRSLRFHMLKQTHLSDIFEVIY